MLRELRKQRGWTQEMIAEKAGVSYVAVSDWERGRRNPKKPNVLSVAAALELSEEAANYLLFLAGFASVPAPDQPKVVELRPGDTALLYGEKGNAVEVTAELLMRLEFEKNLRSGLVAGDRRNTGEDAEDVGGA